MKSTTNKTYRDGLQGLRSQLWELLPAQALSVFDQDAEQLQAQYPSILKVSVGDSAPVFKLPNAVGKEVDLQYLLSKGKVVLVFYRGSWCPYCNLQLALYQEQLDTIESLGAKLVAISPQNPDSSFSMQEKNALRFEVLSDAANEVARQYTSVFKYGQAPYQAMAELGYDFDSFYADASREIPVPAVFIIHQEGSIRFAKAEGGDY